MNNDLIYLKNQMLLSKCSINNKKKLNKKIIISGTHNNRLECFFNKFFLKTKHFGNCAIIRCYDNNRISLIYTGDHNDNSYWLLDEFNSLCKNINLGSDMNISEDTEIYLIRHGKGIHNHDQSLLEKMYYNSLQETKDPSLDQIGVRQAKAAGNFLKYYINNLLADNYKIYFTASHLIRTQQTIGLIMEQMNIKSQIYIAPCTHELIYVKPEVSVSDCDCSVLQNVPVKTNTPNCDINNMCPLLTKFCHTDCYNTNPIPLNWDYYKLFYSQSKFKTKQTCCNNNMIYQIINTIQLAENPNLRPF